MQEEKAEKRRQSSKKTAQLKRSNTAPPEIYDTPIDRLMEEIRKGVRLTRLPRQEDDDDKPRPTISIQQSSVRGRRSLGGGGGGKSSLPAPKALTIYPLDDSPTNSRSPSPQFVEEMTAGGDDLDLSNASQLSSSQARIFDEVRCKNTGLRGDLLQRISPEMISESMSRSNSAESFASCETPDKNTLLSSSSRSLRNFGQSLLGLATQVLSWSRPQRRNTSSRAEPNEKQPDTSDPSGASKIHTTV